MEVRVKEEPGTSVSSNDAVMAEEIVTDDVDSVAETIMDLCKKNARGVPDRQLRKECPVDASLIANAINKLLASDSIELLKQGAQLVYRLKGEDMNRGSDEEERVVYSIIADSGNAGIWLRDIRYKSNLSLTALNKVIKSMEGKKIIKAVKSVTASKKKVYMLYNLEPDRSVTGGAWYSSDQDFEAEFVDVLSRTCLSFLTDRMTRAHKLRLPSDRLEAASATSDDVLKYISGLKISKVDLSKEEIEAILRSLVFDGHVEQANAMIEGSTVKVYRVIRSFSPNPGLMSSPCGVCPVIADCNPEGEVTPIKCIYFNDWF